MWQQGGGLSLQLLVAKAAGQSGKAEGPPPAEMQHRLCPCAGNAVGCFDHHSNVLTQGTAEGIVLRKKALPAVYLDVLDGHGCVQHQEGKEGPKVLRHQDGIEAHDGDGSRLNGPQDDEGSKGHIQARVEAPQEHTGQAVNGQQVDDEGVAAPGQDLQGRAAVPSHRAWAGVRSHQTNCSSRRMGTCSVQRLASGGHAMRQVLQGASQKGLASCRRWQAWRPTRQ